MTQKIPLPVGDRILVRQSKREATKSGIIVASDAEDAMKLPKGEVVSIGEGASFLGLLPGDIIYFNPFAGTNVKFGESGSEEEFLLLTPGEVLLVEKTV